jgi:competence ComEA-like helix-hairpin-helix protein
MSKKYIYRRIRTKIINVLDFSRSEYEGIIILVVILILFFFSRLFIADVEKSQTLIESENLAVELFLQEQKHYHDSILSARNKSFSYMSYPYQQKEQFNRTKLTPFPFDPNAFTFSDWQRLGFTKKQAQQITNYQSKGGYFYEKTDLKKIYSISEEDYQILEPYIQITPVQKQETKERKKETPASFKIELNRTDSIELQEIYGIGQKTASRIIKYREKLGGFTSINQLKEVYSIDSSRFLQISPYLYVNTEYNIKKININKATVKELANHPYIDYYLATSIVNYRQRNGNYTDIKDVKQAVHFYDELYQKIAPYLSVE